MSLKITSEPLEELKLRQHSKQLKEFVHETHFNYVELETLALIYFKFASEDNIQNTQLDRQQFRVIFYTCFYIDDDVLVDRALVYLDKGTNQYVTMETWVKTMSLFLRGTLDEKIAYCFAVYDLNGDRTIRRNEIIKLLDKCFVKEYEEDADLAVKDLADIMIRKMDLDSDGVLSFEDYRNSVRKQPELLECFGQCLPERGSVSLFLTTFTSDNIIF